MKKKKIRKKIKKKNKNKRKIFLCRINKSYESRVILVNWDSSLSFFLSGKKYPKKKKVLRNFFQLIVQWNNKTKQNKQTAKQTIKQTTKQIK